MDKIAFINKNGQKMEILKKLALCALCLNTIAPLSLNATEKTETPIGITQETAEQQIYALLWLLCAEKQEIEKLGHINDSQKEYEETKKELLKNKLRNIISNYPDAAKQVMKKTIESTCLNNKAVLQKSGNKSTDKESTNSIDLDTHCLYLSDILEVFLDAGLDPQVPFKLNILKKFPTEKTIENISSAYWENFKEQISEEIIKEHKDFFATHRSKIIKALCEPLKNLILQALSKKYKRTLNAIKHYITQFDCTSKEKSLFLETLLLEQPINTATQSTTSKYSITDVTNILFPSDKDVTNKQEKVDDDNETFSIEIEEDEREEENPTKILISGGNVEDQKIVEKQKQSTQDLTSSPEDKDKNLITLLHFKQLLVQKQNSKSFSKKEIKNNKAPQELEHFYKNMSEKEIDEKIKLFVKNYPNVSRAIFHTDRQWNERYLTFEKNNISQEKKYKITLSHKYLYKWLLEAGAEPFDLLKNTSTFDHLVVLKKDHLKKHATDTLENIVQWTKDALYQHLLKAITSNNLELAKKALQIYHDIIFIDDEQIKKALETVTNSTEIEIITLLKNTPQNRKNETIYNVWRRLDFFSARAKKNQDNYIPWPSLKDYSLIQATQWCLDNGMNPHSFDTSANKCSHTPLTSLCSINTIITQPTEDEIIEVIKLLLKKGVNINLQDNSGQTALRRAVLNKKIKLVKFLLENGAKPDKNDNLFINKMNNESKEDKILNPTILYLPHTQVSGGWYKNPWIWTGIACGAGLAAWGVYAYLHKKPFVPALVTRYILDIKQRVASRFSTALTPSRWPNGLLPAVVKAMAGTSW